MPVTRTHTITHRTGAFVVLLSTFCFFKSFASDTLKVSLHQADSIFLVNNYYLLAASMNIEAQKAQILQAKLYPNPVFTADINAYDPQNRKILHIGSSGQKVFQVDQLILLAGKRKTEIKMAKTNVTIAELEFQDMVRQLKYKLHKTLFALGQQQYLLDKYGKQLLLLDSIMSGYEIQVAKGNMPLKDLVRLKGVYLSLNNERAEMLRQFFEAQADVQVLLQTDRIVQFRFTDQDIDVYIKIRDLEELKQEALKNHPYLLAIHEKNELARQYLQYQKQLAIPDVNFFSSYDQRGGAFNNQVNTGLAIPLPIWNRNQGNIKAASYRIREAEYGLNIKQQEILSNLQNSYALYQQTIQEYRKATSLYNQDFEITLKGISDNFQKRNVSLIEFVDFFEAYNEAVAEMARIKTQLVTSAEHLNLSIGKDIY